MTRDELDVQVHDSDLGRVTLVAVPSGGVYGCSQVADVIRHQIPRAEVFYCSGVIAIRQPSGPDVVAMDGDTLAIVAGTVSRSTEQ